MAGPPFLSTLGPTEDRLTYLKRRQAADARRQERVASARAKLELRELYKEALTDLSKKK